jgi:hypothetical protein
MRTEATIDIIREFCELNTKSGGICAEWCVGATDDAEHHLFEELGIPRDYHWCIHRRAISAREARAIVLGFHNIGCEASFVKGEDESAVHVFAYRKLAVAQDVAVANAARNRECA